MNRKINAIVAGLTATAALGLVGCSSGSDAKVSGLRDDIKHVTKKTKPATRVVTDYRRDCQTKTRTKTTGSGKNRRTSTESYQDCNRVRTGTHTESYTKTTRSEKWCVELDNVNGKNDADDQWFTVSSGTYAKQLASNEGAKVENMKYQHKGC